MLLIFWIWLSQFVCLVGRICGVRAHFQPNSVASAKIQLSRISAENMVQPAEFLKNPAEGSSRLSLSKHLAYILKTVPVKFKYKMTTSYLFPFVLIFVHVYYFRVFQSTVVAKCVVNIAWMYGNALQVTVTQTTTANKMWLVSRHRVGLQLVYREDPNWSHDML